MTEHQVCRCPTILRNGQDDVIGWHLYDKMPVQE